jgi:hypothetical protein
LTDLRDYRVVWYKGCDVLMDVNLELMWAMSHSQGHPGVFTCFGVAFHIIEVLELMIREGKTTLELDRLEPLTPEIIG